MEAVPTSPSLDCDQEPHAYNCPWQSFLLGRSPTEQAWGFPEPREPVLSSVPSP